MTQPIYQLCEITHCYKNHPALCIEQLSILPASIVGLIGPNGSGKSTLLKLLAFVENPSQGKIFFNGKIAEPFSDTIRFHVTLLTQEPYLMKRSVRENILYGLKIRGDKNNYEARMEQALALVGLSAEKFAQRRWNELSGGEAQRVALAARLILNPKVLLLDEPTANVDAASAQLIKDAVIRVRQEWGTTLIIASHDWNWLYEVCDKVIHLFKGRIFDTGMENIIFGPWNPLTERISEKKLHDGQSVIVPSPPDSSATAMMDAGSLFISAQEHIPDSREHMLRGIISRLILEKSTLNIIATIMVSHLAFTIKITRAQVHELGLYPGKEINVYYDYRSVKWC